MSPIETDNDIARSHVSHKLREMLCQSGWHPNHITIVGILFTIAMLLLHLHGNYAAAAICVLVRSYTDILDGDMARGCGLQSRLGGALDSLSDTAFWYIIGYLLMRQFSTSLLLRFAVPLLILCSMWLYGIVFVSSNVFHDHAQLQQRFPFLGSNTLVTNQIAYALLVMAVLLPRK